jgi:oxalate---CoA ligase
MFSSIESYAIADFVKVYFTDNMPKTATGKIQRRIVADTMMKQDKPKAKL